MEGLFKIDKIDGKGVGWIALRDIKAGTLIYKEKPQFVPEKHYENLGENVLGCLGVMNSFYAMKENDQKEFLELRNCFLDLNSLPDEKKKRYFRWKKAIESFVEEVKAEGLVPYDTCCVLRIFCIFETNQFEGSVEIKASRINHSCIPNSLQYETPGELCEMREVRTTEKILEGQEITISYHHTMKNVKERQKFCQKFGFICTCELCQDEEIKNDDETYEKFQNLEEESKNAFAKFNSIGNNLDQIEKALACQKQMYNLARSKKAPKSIIINILNAAFAYGSCGYGAAIRQKNHGKREYFKEECEKLAKVGYQIAKLLTGKEHSCAKLWKERNEDFENRFKKNVMKTKN